MYDDLSIEQPIPDPFDGDSAVGADGVGCKAGPALGVLFVIIILAVLFVTIIKHK